MDRKLPFMEVAFLGIVGGGAGVGAVLWAAGWLSAVLSGGSWTVRGSEVLIGAIRLLSVSPDPRVAYGAPQAGPLWLFWLCVAAILGIVGLAGAKVVKLLLGKHWGFEKRKRLGSSPEAALASVAELEPLHVERPVEHRFLIGRSGSQMLATENKRVTGEGKRRGPLAHRVDRGAVMFVGPTRCGKSTAALTGILEWSKGPMVLCSVKDDLLGPTLPHRRRVGEVAVFDPTGDLCEWYESAAARGEAMPGWDERLVVGWSPIHKIRNIDDAQRAARALCESAPTPGADGGDFWAAQVEMLLGGLFFVASMNMGVSMASVVSWVLNSEYPTKTNAAPEPKKLLDNLKQSLDPAVSADAEIAEELLRSVWSKDSKIISSVYATAAITIKPWTTRSMRHSASIESINLEWLLSGNNTLYLCAQPQDFERLVAVYGGVINTLFEDCFRHVNRNGPIKPELLIVLDEAGNMPLDKLPTYTSTVAGLGVQLVSLWQDIAQIKLAYGEAADTVVNNHLSKVFFPGQSGQEGLKYIGTLAGDEEVTTVSESQQSGTVFGGSRSVSTQRVTLLPPNVVRMMKPGDAVMFHGTLPPAHITTIPHYKEAWLQRRQKWTDKDDPDAGIPVSLRNSFGVDALFASMGGSPPAGDGSQRRPGANASAPSQPERRRSGPSLRDLVDAPPRMGPTRQRSAGNGRDVIGRLGAQPPRPRPDSRSPGGAAR